MFKPGDKVICIYPPPYMLYPMKGGVYTVLKQEGSAVFIAADEKTWWLATRFILASKLMRLFYETPIHTKDTKHVS